MWSGNMNMLSANSGGDSPYFDKSAIFRTPLIQKVEEYAWVVGATMVTTL